MEIATKGEWEFAIYLSDAQWFKVLVGLINHFGSIYTLLDDFAVFEDTSEGTNIEVIPMRGEAAQRNRAIMEFWRSSRRRAGNTSKASLPTPIPNGNITAGKTNSLQRS